MPRLTGEELSKRAAEARAAKRKAEQPPRATPITLSPDFNQFTGSMGATFGDQGTFFNPSTVFDPRIAIGAPFPPEVN